MQAIYYDRDGRPVTAQRWQQLSRQPRYTRVDHAEVIRHGQQVTVATFWLGAVACDGPGTPLIFCSYGEIRRPGDQRAIYRRTWGWPSLDAARAGHQAVTGWLAQVADWLAGQASHLPAPPPGREEPPPSPPVTALCITTT